MILNVYTQHDLLLNCPDLFHAHYNKNYSKIDIETSLKKPLIEMEQIHSDYVEWAPFKGPCDGLITSKEDQALLIKHADCQAAIFWDPIEKRLACVHAGWRGLVKRIYTRAIEKLKSEGSNPANLLVAIGPSLGPMHAEFQGWKNYFPDSFGDFQVKENYFDLRAIAKDELVSQGILNEHLSIKNNCTFAESDNYHSYRRDKTTLRLSTVAYITTGEYE